MTTIYADIESAIRTRLAANWSATPIKYGNTPSPAVEPPFIYVEIRHTGSRQTSVGTGDSNRRFRQTGLIIIGIYVKKNDGTGLAAQYADTLCDIFRGKTFGGVVCSNCYPDGGRPADDQGNYWMKTLFCEFYSDALA